MKNRIQILIQLENNLQSENLEELVNILNANPYIKRSGLGNLIARFIMERKRLKRTSPQRAEYNYTKIRAETIKKMALEQIAEEKISWITNMIRSDEEFNKELNGFLLNYLKQRHWG